VFSDAWLGVLACRLPLAGVRFCAFALYMYKPLQLPALSDVELQKEKKGENVSKSWLKVFNGWQDEKMK
jgi:hypothetical protein